ncbi:hypothetical protein C8Q76DRAFT_754855 [Earliella scabrosa]|nr:hypothetical protein C8Q76DRAFT_754855 [Earliella scabrosa]
MPIAPAQRHAPRQASDSLSDSLTDLPTTGGSSSTRTGSATTTTPTSSAISGSSSASITAVISTTSASSTSDPPFFPSPTGTPVSGDGSSGLEFTKNAVESALIVAAIALIIALTSWRLIKLRHQNRPLGHFFRAEPQPDVPPRPRAVPRTTGLPSVPAPPAAVICDMLPMALHGEHRRGRGRRTRAGDIGEGGRRGNIAHPDDPDEFLPEYDDKDVLPRYQDVQSSSAAAAAGARWEGSAPNGRGGTNDTIPLVTRMQVPSSTTLEDGRPPASVDSHDRSPSPSPHPQQGR